MSNPADRKLNSVKATSDSSPGDGLSNELIRGPTVLDACLFAGKRKPTTTSACCIYLLPGLPSDWQRFWDRLYVSRIAKRPGSPGCGERHGLQIWHPTAARVQPIVSCLRFREFARKMDGFRRVASTQNRLEDYTAKTSQDHRESRVCQSVSV